jgi:hypothetical protein
MQRQQQQQPAVAVAAAAASTVAEAATAAVAEAATVAAVARAVVAAETALDIGPAMTVGGGGCWAECFCIRQLLKMVCGGGCVTALWG